MMEVMQCGLNWNMIIQKREIFRACFDDFDFDKVALYGGTDIERILGTDRMIRSRRKIEAAIYTNPYLQEQAMHHEPQPQKRKCQEIWRKYRRHFIDIVLRIIALNNVTFDYLCFLLNCIGPWDINTIGIFAPNRFQPFPQISYLVTIFFSYHMG